MMIYVITGWHGEFIAAHENSDSACKHYEKFLARTSGLDVQVQWNEEKGFMMWNYKRATWDEVKPINSFPTIQKVQLWI